MDASEYRKLQDRFEALNDETLLNYIRNPEDFSSQALGIIREILEKRGYTSCDFTPEPSTRQNRDSDRVTMRAPRGDLVPLGEYDDPILITQVRDILEQEGIYTFKKEILDGIFGYNPFPVGEGQITLYVCESDLARAREILSTFPPLAEDCPDDDCSCP